MEDHFDHVFIAPGQYDTALAIYRDVLGWRVTCRWGDEGGPRGCELDGGDVRLVLGEQHEADDHSWSSGFNGRRPTLHLRVPDLDARFAQVSDASSVVVAPEATHWGTRWFVLRDPGDNLIAFEQPLAR
jgi:uncharacterized glyoxalase superfamily protein PhnB